MILIERQAANRHPFHPHFVALLAVCGMLLLSHTAFAQDPAEDDLKVILRGSNENVYTYVPPDQSAGKASGVTIDVTFVGPGWTPSMENAFRFAADLWSAYLTSPVPITVEAALGPVGGGVIAETDIDVVHGMGLPLSSTNYPTALAEKILGVDLNGGDNDIEIRFDSGVSWYAGLDGQTPGGSYDLATVALHELVHGFGFFSKARTSGLNGRIRDSGRSFVYDHFVEDGAGVSLLDTGPYSDPGLLLFAALNGGAGGLHFGGLFADVVGPVPLYAPSPFAGALSYIHLDEATFPPGDPSSLVTPFLSMAEAIHSPGKHVLAMLRDLGWMSLPDSQFDFGDAPIPFPTLEAGNGARHLIPSGGATLVLGKLIDTDSDGLPEATAKGDDLDGTDDEDGILSFNNLVAFSAAATTGWIEVEVTGGPGVLNAWMDFNGNGDWVDAGEQILTNEPVVSGIQNLLFPIPSGAQTLNPTFARFRLSSIPDITYQGVAPDGEVEDYQVVLINGDANEAQVALVPGLGDATVVLDGVNFQVWQNGILIFEVPLGLLTNGIEIIGTDDADLLTIDFTGGLNPIPIGGLTFNGGNPTAVPGDALQLSNGTFGTTTYGFTNESDGTINLDGSMIAYTGLEPIFDLLSVTDRIFNFGAGGQLITLGDDGDLNNNKSFIDSDGSESVTFTNPTNSLTINADGGPDEVTVNTLDRLFEADLTINGQGGDDEISINDAYKPGNRATVTVNGGTDEDIISVLASSLPRREPHFLTGDGGVDVFNLSFDPGEEIPDQSGTALSIDGGAPNGVFPTMDVLNIHTNGVGDGMRSVDVVYNSDLTSDFTVLGLGTENGIDVLHIEKLNYTGDDANDDDVKATYTDNLDVVTVEPTAIDAANVFLGGSPFTGVTPPLSLDAPGVEGGEFGPDLMLSGLSSTGGLILMGEDPTTVPGDELYYHGTGYIEVTGTASGRIIGGGVLDVHFLSFENHYTSGLSHVLVTADTDANDTFADLFTVRMLGPASTEVVVEVNGTIKHKHELAEVGIITINGSGDDDRLIIDMVDGNPIPSGGLFFNGDGGFDDIVLDDGSFETITHVFATANDGTVHFEVPEDRLLTYTGLEPIADNLGAVHRVFDFSGADDLATLDPHTVAGFGIISTSTPTSETVTFPYPTGTLTVNGNGGEDDITVNALTGGFDADLTVNGGLDDDIITINATSGSKTYAANGDDGADTINTFATSGTFITGYTLTGGTGHDRFNVQPDFHEILVHGNDPTFPDFPGDVLDIDLTGVLGDDITMTGVGAGEWTFTNRSPVEFTGIEALIDAADLSIEKDVDNGTPIVEEDVTFTIVVTNDGATGHAFAVSVLDLVPPGMLFLSHSGDGSYDGGTGIWTIGDIPKDETRTLSITAKMRASTVVTNTATILAPAGYVNYPMTDSDDAIVVPFEQTTIWRNANREAATVTAIGHSSTTAKSTVTGTLFLGTDGGGVFRSIDGGDNWYPMGEGTLDEAFVRQLQVSSKNDALWVVTYGKGAWRSTTLGETFTQVFDAGDGSDEIVSLAINTFHPASAIDGDVYLGTDGDGIFRSTDEGASWTDITGNLTYDRIMSIYIESGGAGGSKDRIWIGTYGGGVFYRDYKADKTLQPNWVAANGSVADPLGNKIVHAVTLSRFGYVFAGTLGGVYRSTDDGASWTLVEDGKIDQWSPAMAVRTFLTYFDGVTEFIWAGTDGEYIYRALDDGGGAALGAAGTWEQETGFPALQGTSGLQSSTIYDLFYVDGYLFAGTRDKGLHRSTTSGQWWDVVQAEVLNPVIQAMTFSSEGERLFAGTYGWGILMTDDFDGATFVNWTRVNNGLSNHWVYAMETKATGGQDLLFAGTWGGGIFRSDNDGESWQFNGLPHGIIHDLALNEDGVLFAAQDNGIIARTHDNGLTWQEIGVATTAIWSIGIDPKDADNIFAGTAGKGIYMSTDGGFTFVPSGLTDRHVFSIEFDIETTPATIYAGTATGVLKSTDLGSTWTDFSVGLTVPETRTLSIINLIPGKPLMTAGTWGGGVFTYNWDVNAWIRDGLGQAPIVAFAINEQTREGFISTNEGGLYRKHFPAPKTGTSADDSDRELPEEYLLGQNYPNPFNPQTNIEFALPENAQVRLAVFDALGRQVSLLMDGQLAAGHHEVTFEANSLPSGAYFYQLQTGGHVYTRKMILMK